MALKNKKQRKDTTKMDKVKYEVSADNAIWVKGEVQRALKSTLLLGQDSGIDLLIDLFSTDRTGQRLCNDFSDEYKSRLEALIQNGDNCITAAINHAKWLDEIIAKFDAAFCFVESLCQTAEVRKAVDVKIIQPIKAVNDSLAEASVEANKRRKDVILALARVKDAEMIVGSLKMLKGLDKHRAKPILRNLRRNLKVFLKRSVSAWGNPHDFNWGEFVAVVMVGEVDQILKTSAMTKWRNCKQNDNPQT
jgi:hypothetical protein